MQILGAWRHGAPAIDVLALLAAFSAAALPAPSALAQSRVDIFAPGMPAEMKPQTIPLDNGTVRAPAPVAAPPPVSYDVPSAQFNSQGATKPALTPQQYDYLKQNAVGLQPTKPPSPTTMQNRSYQAPTYYQSEVTGFAPQRQIILQAQPQPHPSLTQIVGSSTQKLNTIVQSKPSQVILDYTKTAGGVLATNKSIVSPGFRKFSLGLGVAADAADVISAYRNSGALGAAQKTSEIVAVRAAKGAAGLAAAPFGPNAVMTAKVAAGVGTKATIDLGTKYAAPKLADIWLGADKKYGLTSTGRTLQQKELQIQELQRRLDAARQLKTPPGQALPGALTKSGKSKFDLASFGVTKKDIATAKSTPQVATTKPTDTDFGSAPGKPANATNPRPQEPRSNAPQKTYRPLPQRHQYARPRYRYVRPQVNCVQLRNQVLSQLMSTGPGYGSAGYANSLVAQLRAQCPGY